LASKEFLYSLPVNIMTAIFCVSALCLDGCSGHTSYKPDREIASYQQRETVSYHKPDREVAKYKERGTASYYAKRFHNRKTASGERFNNRAMTAAHRTLPFGTEVIVKNINNGKSVNVRINDRGPFVKGRVIDLTRAAFSQIASLDNGIAKVEIRIVR
jgi:rare lipoprotein A